MIKERQAYLDGDGWCDIKSLKGIAVAFEFWCFSGEFIINGRLYWYSEFVNSDI